MKHKHYDAIIAWASGEVIESRIQFANGTYTGWEIDKTPDWYSRFHEFRVKQVEPKYKVLFICYGGVTISKDYYATLEEFNKTSGFVGLQLLESLKEE